VALSTPALGKSPLRLPLRRLTSKSSEGAWLNLSFHQAAGLGSPQAFELGQAQFPVPLRDRRRRLLSPRGPRARAREDATAGKSAAAKPPFTLISTG